MKKINISYNFISGVFYFLFFLIRVSSFQLSAQSNLPITFPGLSIWLNSDSTKVDGTGRLYKWTDLSGNNNHAVQSSVSKQPLKLNNQFVLNNKSTVLLDGIDDFLEIPDANSIDFNSGFTFFIVLKQNVALPAQAILCKWDFGIQGSWAFETGSSNGLTTYILNSLNGGGGNQVQTANPLFDLQNYNIITLIYDGNQNANNRIRSYINGILMSSSVVGAINPTLVNSSANLKIGEFTNLGRYFGGNFSEIVVYNRAVLNTEKNQVEQYLYDKYAPPITLPPDILITNSVCDTTIIQTKYYTNYQWSTGATTPTISVNKTGKYWVNAINIFGKVSSDTILVNYPNYNKPLQKNLCSGNQLKWNTQLPKSKFTFLWQNNSIDSVFTITQAGNYYVKITDSFGCSITSDTVKIAIDNFSTTASLGPDVSLCSGNLITLTSGASPTLTYTWSTGSFNNSIVITNSGQYSVIVTNTNSCIAKDTINVTVLGQAPIANFSYNAGCLNSAVSFTNLSIPPSGNTITNYDWSFGDPLSAASNTSTAANPFHTFSDTGTYSIKLKVITNVGCKQTITKTIHIAPTPTVNFSNGISCQNDSTAFSSSIINTPGYSITSLSWNFGDSSSGLNNISNLPSPKHLFSNQTNYSVTLIATNSAGCATSLTKAISVKAQVTASFTNSPLCSNTSVIFQDNSTAPIGSSRLWNFGTSTQSGITATKTYTSSGVYSITLTVTGTNFCTSKISKQIIVFLPPAVNFTAPSFCSKDTITAVNQSAAQSGIISSYNWQSNNTTFSAVQNPTLTATSAGTYSVKLIVVNSFNCKDSITKAVTVFPLPNVDFMTNPTSYYFINSPVNFIPTITNATSYLWNITGVPTTTIQSPTVSFNTQGTYTVSLNLKDQQGCRNSRTKTILVSKRFLDLAILNVNTLKDGDGFVTVEADIANSGSVPVTSFEIHYQISDGGNIKETWNGTLNPNAFYVYTFTAKSATQKNNSNNITCVEIEKANGVVDENTSNNKLCNTLNVDEISVSNPIPNPTNADITLPIILNKDVDFTIAIYNSIGQIIYAETTKKGATGLNFTILPTSSYARGCYIIKIMIDGKIFIKKFIKISTE